MKIFFLLSTCLLLAGCGGRVPHPVSATNYYDDRLSCDHLRAEREVNNSKLADLGQERKNGNTNNFGMVLLSPMMMDLSSAERKEADALGKRNEVLDDLISRKCTP